MKDQSKKVANLKHKEQLEKSRNAQLMEDAKKREDNLNESSQQIKVPRGGGRGYMKARVRKSLLCPTLNIVCHHNNASSERDNCGREQPRAMSDTHTQSERGSN